MCFRKLTVAHVTRSAEEDVEKRRQEGAVQAVQRLDTRQQRVAHGLRNIDDSNGESAHHVHQQPVLHIIHLNPEVDWKEAQQSLSATLAFAAKTVEKITGSFAHSLGLRMARLVQPFETAAGEQRPADGHGASGVTLLLLRLLVFVAERLEQQSRQVGVRFAFCDAFVTLHVCCHSCVLVVSVRSLAFYTSNFFISELAVCELNKRPVTQ